MSANTFGIMPEQVSPIKKPVAVKLTHEQAGIHLGPVPTKEELREREDKARVRHEAALDRHSQVVGRLYGDAESRGKAFDITLELLTQHFPTGLEPGSRYYAPECLTCSERDSDGDSYQLDWPCETFELIEGRLNE